MLVEIEVGDDPIAWASLDFAVGDDGVTRIGHVDIREDHTFVGLPKGMPEQVLAELRKTRVAGQMLRMSLAAHVPPKPLRKPPKRAPKRTAS